MRLHGEVIVITGAAQGLGQKMAETVAGSGRPITLPQAAVAAMTVTWAEELARYKILVAGIAPGDAHGCEHQIRDKIVSGIPLRRFAKPEEIARAALFVLQNDCDDGRVLEIDGGLRLWAAGAFAAFCPVSNES
ncbi:MAG: SDR family oxidoreductase [Rhodomicrobium sp.]